MKVNFLTPEYTKDEEPFNVNFLRVSPQTYLKKQKLSTTNLIGYNF